MKPFAIGLTALFVFQGIATPGFAQTQTISRLEIQGLERVTFDRWTAKLAQGSLGSKQTNNAGADWSVYIGAFGSERELFQTLLTEISGYRLQSATDYQNLTTSILQLRQSLRQRLTMNDDTKRDSMYMLQLMAEEAAYVGSKKFKDFSSEIAVDNSSSVLDSSRTNSLRGMTVQTGDLLLSKSTGSGSSSFIALSMKNPHLFSHSTPVFVDKAENKLLSPEAFIEDGVKLRTLESYQEGSRTRLAVYRYKGLDTDDQKRVQHFALTRADEFVSKMRQMVSDPENQASYGYDFGMDPVKAEGKSYFCSGISYELYPKDSKSDLRNPYAEEVWSRIVGARRSIMSTLGINSLRIPAPGDVEMNPLFELVGFRINMAKLEQERVENAIIDLFLKWAERNKSELEQLSSSLETLGDKPIAKAEIEALVAKGLIPADKKDLILKTLQEIPEGVNMKQLVFFYTMNDIMTPKIRAQVMAELAKSSQIVGPLAIREMVARAGQGQMDQLLTAILSQVKSL